jgi:hypothetical protein
MLSVSVPNVLSKTGDQERLAITHAMPQAHIPTSTSICILQLEITALADKHLLSSIAQRGMSGCNAGWTVLLILMPQTTMPSAGRVIHLRNHHH